MVVYIIIRNFFFGPCTRDVQWLERQSFPIVVSRWKRTSIYKGSSLFISAVDMKNDFLCGSAADYTMSMRHPKDCVGFDTFRWYSDNGEVSALDRITDWRQSKTEHTHITRERASLLNPPSGSANVVCCIQTLIASLIMLRIISLWWFRSASPYQASLWFTMYINLYYFIQSVYAIFYITQIFRPVRSAF